MGELRLGDIATIVDCEHKTAPLVESSEYISVRTTDIANGKIDFQKANRVSAETFSNWTKRAIPTEGDIILAREAPVGEVGWVGRERKVCLGQRTVLIRPHSERIVPKFLLYYLANPSSKYDFRNQSAGSVVEHLNVANIRNFELRVDQTLPEQNAIAEVLSSLDDKIALLHRQNKTLESLAQTLFRQWFIEESDGQVGKLGDLVELHYGKGLKEEIRTGQGFPVIGSSGIVGYHSEYLVDGPGIVIGRKGTLGKVVYVYDNFFPIDTTYFVKSRTEPNGLFYEYFLLQTLNFEEMNSDSAVPGLNRDIALATEVRIPLIERQKDFDVQCSQLFQKKRRNSEQIKLLTRLRDSLLPKLMNGEAIAEI